MNIIVSFLRQLVANNNKPWFDAHKGEYLEARAHFGAFICRGGKKAQRNVATT